MTSFIVCLSLLIISYFTYGRYVTYIFHPDGRETPAIAQNDGVDYVIMPKWKLFLIQLLNIAGLGPIYGALAGAQWGPSVFLWITFGTIFAGTIHDFSVGFISMRHKGASVSEITGGYLGKKILAVMRVFSVILLLLTGTVFAVGPAGMITNLIKDYVSVSLLTSSAVWLTIIFVYYFIATFISIDKIIGKLYPLFGICLIFMAAGVIYGVVTKGYVIPEISLVNMHPDGKPIWPMMFVTVACGAISGFHATQSPLMARCCQEEKDSQFVFSGAMICEGIIALVWAAAGCAIYEKTGGLQTGLTQMIMEGGQGAAVYDICKKTMGGAGIVLAMIGVIACPITSGDTAFRSARLILADWFRLDQKIIPNRLLISVPLLLSGAVISRMNYDVIWRYFSWSNQTLAMIVLWAASMYLYKLKKNYWITVAPAIFMTGVSFTYLLMADECFRLPKNIAYPAGLVIALAVFILFLRKTKKPIEEKEFRDKI